MHVDADKHLDHTAYALLLAAQGVHPRIIADGFELAKNHVVPFLDAFKVPKPEVWKVSARCSLNGTGTWCGHGGTSAACCACVSPLR